MLSVIPIACVGLCPIDWAIGFGLFTGVVFLIRKIKNRCSSNNKKNECNHKGCNHKNS